MPIPMLVCESETGEHTPDEENYSIVYPCNYNVYTHLKASILFHDLENNQQQDTQFPFVAKENAAI